MLFTITITRTDRSVYSYVITAPSSAAAYCSVSDDEDAVRIEVCPVHSTADEWDYV